MKKIRDNINLILYFSISCALIIIMFWAISQKQGFHEDEIFSYGASNSSLANTLVTHGKRDVMEIIMQGDNVFGTIKNVLYYKILSPDSYGKEVDKIMATRPVAIWRTNADAKEYLQIDNFKEAINFASVWWNTAKDVHPPLFYFAVHIVSILFFGQFSKYIIFSVNLIFYILTLMMLRKIFVILDKRDLSILNLILYGASVGAIATVIFQRMYMMLTFFTIWLLYINLKIFLNNFEIDKKDKIELGFCIILGFLTQYYFCFYAIFLFLAMMIIMLRRNEKRKIINLLKYYAIFAIIAIMLFVPCLNHLFFSYRGINSLNSKYTYLNKIKEFAKQIFSAYSINKYIGVLICIFFASIVFTKTIKKKNIDLYYILILPIIIYFFIVAKVSPYRSLRYMMNILPIISIIIVLLMDELIQNKKVLLSCLSVCFIGLTTYGLLTNPIQYLYKGSDEYLKIAEKYKNDRFLLICTNEFNHIKDMQEFCIYKESMIVPPEEVEFLNEVEEFKEDDEIVLAIKNWLDESPEEIVRKSYRKYTL